MPTPDQFNQRGARNLPGHLGIVVTHVAPTEVRAELKSNHLGTARDGTIACTATPVHLGRTTQVWDATVSHRETGKTIALFRCTQLLLYAKQGF